MPANTADKFAHQGDAAMNINYEAKKVLSIYDNALDSCWFSVNRYYSITYPYREMEMLHAHSEIEIMYVVSGKCTINLETGGLPLQEGDYIFLDSLVPHSLSVEAGSPCRMLNLEAALVETSGSLRLVTLTQEEAFRKLRAARLPHFQERDEEGAVKGGILNLHRLLQNGAPPLDVKFQLSLVLLEISRQHFQDRKKKPQGIPTYVKRAMHFITENFDRELSIDAVAEVAGISKAHLQRTFLKYEGCTIVDAINRLRLDKARFLLVTSGIPVIEIANEVGFSSRQYFTGLFTRSTGLSPAKYRKHQRGNMAAGFDGADMGVELSSHRH